MNTREVTRKLVRWSVLGIGALLLTTALGSFALHTYGAIQLKTSRADFDRRWGHLARIGPPESVSDRENGARWLVAGGQAIQCSVDDRQFFVRLSERATEDWSDAEMTRAQRILREQKDALENLIFSGQLEGFNLGADGIHAHYAEVDFSSIVLGLRLLVLKARHSLSEGQTDDFLSSLNAAGRATDGLLKTPIVMTSIIGSATTRWSARAAVELVNDPCTGSTILEELMKALPSEDPNHSAQVSFATAVAEIADEGLQYTESEYDPSLGWSIPFWVLNRYLLEDLFVAEILDRWNRFLDFGQRPAATWPPRAFRAIGGDDEWPLGLALTGGYTPNLMSPRARAQAASAELQQIRLAIELRLASPTALDSNACSLVDNQQPTPLTGTPVDCRYDENRDLIVLDVPGATKALSAHVTPDNPASEIPPIELPVGDFGCTPP